MGQSELTRFDQVGAWASLILVASLLAMPISVTPHFAGMFTDFGGELPWITRAVLSGWLPPIAAVLPGALLLGALLTRDRLDLAWRRFMLLTSFVTGFCGVALVIAGLYAPIFALADKVHG